jgi:branched-chain amino acid aminotransferase
MNIEIMRTTNPRGKPEDENVLGFGKVFSDHMFLMEYDVGIGWHSPRIEPYRSLSIDPASPALHYGQQIFEGLKAYRSPENDILLFRFRENAKRLNQSAERMSMPTIDVEDQCTAIETIVRLEREWVPHSQGTSLYLRPAMIADGSALGSYAARRYLYFIICSPVGAYFRQGLSPIRIYVEDDDVRAVRGGVGCAKTGGNYAASFHAAARAEERGFDQVLWLDGVERQYVEEVGAMNMMFLIGDTICTPSLEGSILPGITRTSILQLAQDMGIRTEERRISIDGLIEAGRSRELKEAFGTGTAAVVAPVGEFEYRGQRVTINGGETGPVTKKLHETLTGIQQGLVADSHGWVTRV